MIWEDDSKTYKCPKCSMPTVVKFVLKALDGTHDGAKCKSCSESFVLGYDEMYQDRRGNKWKLELD